MYSTLLCWRRHAHLVGSDILQSSLSYHTHTLHPPKSLSGGRVPLRDKRVPEEEQGEGSVLAKGELSKTTVVFFLSLGVGSLLSSSLFQFA